MAKKVLKYHYRPPQKVKLRKREISNGIFVAIALLFVVFVLSVGNVLPSNLVGFATVDTVNGKIIVDNVGDNLVLKLNIATKQVNGVYVEMVVKDLCTALGDVSKVEGKLWNEFKDVKCSGDKLIFGDATLNQNSAKSGEFLVLQFPSKGLPTKFNVTIPKIDAYDISDGKDLFEDKAYNFNIDLSNKNVQNQTKTEVPSAPTGGGGTYCTSDWKCTDWSYCNNQLKQDRICSDLKSCQKNKAESRVCAKCDESWQCSAWSSCSYNQQTRKCSDEHSCGTVTKKPEETRSCSEVIAEQSQQYQLPVQEYQQPQQPAVQQPAELSFFDKYMTYLLAIPFVLLFVVILVLAVMHFTHRAPQTSFNYNELKDWIKKERSAGSSDDEIRDILAQNTGWKSEDISKMFNEIGK